MNSKLTKIVIASMAAIILVLATVLITNAVNKHSESTKKTAETNQTEDAPQEPTEVLKNAELVEMGTVAKYALINMKVNNVTTDTTITSYGKAHMAEEGTKYLIVNTTVTNTSKQPYSYDPFQLLSNDGTLITASTSEESYGEDSLAFKELNPGVPMTGTTVYTIPVSMKSTNIGGMRGTTDIFVGTKLNFN